MDKLEKCIKYVKDKYYITEITEEKINFITDCFYLKVSGETAYDMGLEYSIIWTLVVAWLSDN